MIGWIRKRVAAAGSGPDDGFTIIEVLVAAFILVLGALAVFMTFASAIHNVQRSKETQQGVNVAQREMELIRVKEFPEIGDATESVFPTPSEPLKPTSRVGDGGGTFELNRSGGDPKPIAPGLLEAGPVRRTSEDGTEVDVYRFVVCEEGEVATCAQKRIVVDVVPIAADNEHDYQHSYYELQSTVVNPALLSQ